MFEYDLRTARKLGAYQAIADMMQTEIRKLDATLAAKDEWMSKYHMHNLVSLADQLEAAEEKFKKEVDNAVA
jgi:hypothetical protein